MRYSAHFLDTFVAPKYSEVGKPDPPDISHARARLVDRFILTTGVIQDLLEPYRSYILQFLRRAESALEEYEEARKLLGTGHFSDYFLALSHYETAIAHSYQSLMSGNRLAGRKLFEPGDGSPAERLHKLYNASKHAESKIDHGLIPENGSLTIWLTRDGVECSETFLSFEELARCILDLSDLGSKFLDTIASQAQRAPAEAHSEGDGSS